MKKFIWGLFIIIIIATVGIGIWGFIEAQSAKRQSQELEDITSDVLKLNKIENSNTEISLIEWEDLANGSSLIGKKLEKNPSIPRSLRDKMEEFFSAKPSDKYREAQYLQVLLEGEVRFNLKDQQPKSKEQIEEIVKAIDETQNEINQKGLSLGPEYNQKMKDLEKETASFKTSCNDIVSKTTSDSPPTQLSSAGMDKAMDDLKTAIINSLNNYVDLQDEIKREISGMATANWVIPF